MSAIDTAKTLCTYDTTDLPALKWTEANAQAKHFLRSFSNSKEDAINYLSGSSVFSKSYTSSEDDDGYLVLTVTDASEYFAAGDSIYINGTQYNQIAYITAVSGNEITTNLLYANIQAVAASLTVEVIGATEGALDWTIAYNEVGYKCARPAGTIGEVFTFVSDLANWTTGLSAGVTLSGTSPNLVLTAATAGIAGNDIAFTGEADVTDPATITNLAGGADAYADTGTLYNIKYYDFELAEAWLTLYALVRTAQQIVNNKILHSSQNFGEGSITQAGMETKQAYQNECLKNAKSFFKMGGSTLI